MKICQPNDIKLFCKDYVEKAEYMFILATSATVLIILSLVSYKLRFSLLKNNFVIHAKLPHDFRFIIWCVFLLITRTSEITKNYRNFKNYNIYKMLNWLRPKIDFNWYLICKSTLVILGIKIYFCYFFFFCKKYWLESYI